MLQVFGACLSDSDISPSNDPPTAATRSCISTLYASGAISVMVLQPGMQRVSTFGSLSATQRASTEAGIASLPPISSFTAASQPKQLLHQSAIDARAFGIAEGRFLHDLVVIHRRQRGIGIAELVLVERVVPAEPPDHIGQRGAADAGDDLDI